MPVAHFSFVRRVLGFRYFVAVNLVLAILIGGALTREYLRQRENRSDIAALRAQADALSARQLQLLELGTTLQTESAIEREARLKLGLKKPGETVVVVRAEAPGYPLSVTAGVATDPFGL